MSLFVQIYRSVTKRKHTLQGLSFLSLSNIVTSFTGLFSVVVLANLLNSNEYGTYKYIFSVVGILSALSFTGGYRNMIIQSVAKGLDGVVQHLYKINPLFNLPMIVGACLISIYYLYKGNTTLGFSIPIVAIGYIFSSTLIITYSYLNGRKEYKDLFFLQSAISVASVLLLTITVFVTKNIALIFLSSVIGSGIMSTISYYYIKRSRLRNNTFHEKMLQYGKHLSIMNIGSTLLIHIDSFLIFSFLGSHELALYALATPFVDRIIGFFKTSYFFVLPKFTEMGPEKAALLLYKRSFMGLAVGLAVSGIYYLIAPTFFSIFFPKYIDSIQLSVLFSLSIPLVAFSTLPTAFVDSLIEIKIKYILFAVNFVTRITTLFLFIHTFGVAGVIISELVSRVVTTIALFYVIEKHLRDTRKKAKSVQQLNP